MPKISVVIPVYKVEKYLRQCVDSVLNQTFRDIEVILVDDGSPDRCPQICDDYEIGDPRVKVIHKDNGGLSDARNKGIEVASGEYGIFIDSDDYWDNSNALDCLIRRMEVTRVDVLSFPYQVEDERTGTKQVRAHCCDDMPVKLRLKEDQLEYHVNKELYIASACNKLVKMYLLKAIPFETGKFSEDIEWCARLMQKAHSFDYVNCCFYCYRQRVGSISHTISLKNCSDLKDAIIGCYTIMQNSSKSLRPYLGNYTAYQFSTFIAVQSFSNEFPYKCIQELSKYCGILKYNHISYKVRIMYLGTKTFGLVKWCKLIRATKRIWNSRRNIQ